MIYLFGKYLNNFNTQLILFFHTLIARELYAHTDAETVLYLLATRNLD